MEDYIDKIIEATSERNVLKENDFINLCEMVFI